jgi:hypothetical protein
MILKLLCIWLVFIQYYHWWCTEPWTWYALFCCTKRTQCLTECVNSHSALICTYFHLWQTLNIWQVPLTINPMVPTAHILPHKQHEQAFTRKRFIVAIWTGTLHLQKYHNSVRTAATWRGTSQWNDTLVLKFQIGLALYVTAYRSITKNLTYMRALQLLRTVLMQFWRHLSVRTFSLTSTTFWNRKKIHLWFGSNLRLQHSYAEIKKLKSRTLKFALMCTA